MNLVMTIVPLFIFLVAIGFQLLTTAPSHAQVRPVDRPIASEVTNERGFTLDMFDTKLWALARHPLSPASMSQLGDAVHQAPARGIQVELLTPGDFGVSIHLYW